MIEGKRLRGRAVQNENCCALSDLAFLKRSYVILIVSLLGA